jgi:hypothetical protein
MAFGALHNESTLTCVLPMTLNFNWTQPVQVYGLHLQLVVTTALIVTFFPAEKGQRWQASLCAVVSRANPVGVFLTNKRPETV